MPSFFIPLTGLGADSTALNTIANNLANMSTTAFKAQTTNFADLFYQQFGSTGSGDAIQGGVGVKVASNNTDFTQGSYNTSGTTASDVALNGSGFFVVGNGASNVYTRDGAFSLNTNGNLVTADGLTVMGYPAVNGVVNTTAPITAVNIPVGQVEQPQATSTLGMTANLNSNAAVGSSFPGEVTVYDSLGNAYQATVTFTKTGTNQWSYNVALPDSMQAPPATASTVTFGVPTASSTPLAGITTVNYNFGSSGGAVATVDPSTAMTITGPTAVAGVNATTAAPAVAAGETVAAYAAALQAAVTAAGITGVTVNSTAGGQLSIVGAGVTTAGAVIQTEAAKTINYTFGSNGGSTATVDPGSNLAITGLNAAGSTETITAPAVTAGETVAAYAAALQAAVTATGITGINVSSAGGVLSITGSNMTTTGTVVQDPVASLASNGTLTFDSSGNLATPSTNIGGITFSGLSDGASTLNLQWDLYGLNGKGSISQTVAASEVSTTTQNGYPSGQYQSFAIGSDGTVTASYSNGKQQAVGQLALANVTNLEGLVLQGNGEYATTLASGPAQIGISGTAGLGTVQDSALEQSNVNISAEFSNLIIAQRAFEANAKSVTTFDTVTQDTINMVH